MNLYLTADFDGHVQLWAKMPTYYGLEWEGSDFIAGWGKYAAKHHNLPEVEPGKMATYSLDASVEEVA